MDKFLITGGAGFIGSNFVHLCLENNHKVLNYDLLTYAGNLNNLQAADLDSNYQFVKGDICDNKLFSNCLNEFKPDYIVNFAAESHVDRSIDSPDSFIKTNINGTFQILSSSYDYFSKLAKDNKFRFLHVSTDEVYGSLGSEGFFTEKTAYNPSSPYSASKASSDHLVNAYVRTHKIDAVISNCSNNYGPRQFPEKLIPKIIYNILNNKPLPIYSKGKNLREWIYVNDHCDALIKLFFKGRSGEKYNIGSGINCSNIFLVKKILKSFADKKIKIGKKVKIKFVKDRPGHDFRYALNSNKIKKELKWKPKINLNQGISKTVDWYIKNQKYFKKLNEKNFSYRW